MSTRAKIFFFNVLLLGNLFAQSDSLNNVETILNLFINSATIEKEGSELYDLIEYYLENKIDLNNSTKSDLMKLPFANIDEVNEIIKYRNRNGNIFSYAELKSNNSISDSFIKLLKIFTYLQNDINNFNKIKSNNYNFKLRTRLSYNLQESKGFVDGYYKGSPLKIYNRIKLNANSKILVGALVEKDAGDISYFDFYSFYVLINNLLNGLQIYSGYYTMEFGQGLAMWSPYSFSKSSDATNSVIKRARGISPYASAGEIAFLKGIALNYSTKHFSISSFYSIDNDELFLPNKNTFGFSVRVTPINNFNISGFYYQSFVPQQTSGNTFFDESIKKYYSVSYNGTYKNLFITGEYAFCNSAIASINTMQISVHRNFLIIASIRNYPSNYKSYYARGFGETNRTNDEFGIYFGLKWKTDYGIVNFYLDQFKFSNNNRNVPLPSNGNEISVSYAFKPVNKGTLYFRYFTEQKEDIELISEENKIIERRTNKLRSEFLFNVNKSLRFKTRIEFLHLSKSGITNVEKGLLLFQDFQYKIRTKFTLYGRIIFFDTDSFASRIYEFENDLIGVMKNQPLWGKGINWYALLRYSPFIKFNISAKYSELLKPNEAQLGSGYNSINNNLDNKFSIQVDYSF